MNRIFALALGALLTLATTASAFTYQTVDFIPISREFPAKGLFIFVATGESGDTYATGGVDMEPAGFSVEELINCFSITSGTQYFSQVRGDTVKLYDDHDDTAEAFLELDNSTSLDGATLYCTGIALRD